LALILIQLSLAVVEQIIFQDLALVLTLKLQQVEGAALAALAVLMLLMVVQAVEVALFKEAVELEQLLAVLEHQDKAIMVELQLLLLELLLLVAVAEVLVQ
jgi:hypothetical protein